MNIYFKNFIICGEIDYYCLLCQECFRNLESVDKHLKWEKHRKAVKEKEYAYKKEFIYKVRDMYYCEICNELVSVVAKHKALDSHINKKKSLKNDDILKKGLAISRNPDDSFTIENDYKLSFLQWHGIKNDYCTLCRRSVRNVTMHINLDVHVINLIGCETKIFQEYYYRKISEDQLYCFLCCQVFPNESLQTHWSQDCDVTFKAKVVLSESDRKLIKNDPELATALFAIQRLFFNIDIDNNKAECLQCKKTVKPTLEILLKHRNKHLSKEKTDSESTDESYEVQYSEVADHGKRRHEIAKYSRKNYIKLNEGGSWGYCSICDVSISAHMKQILDHVKGLRHKAFLQFMGVKKSKPHKEPPCPKQKFTSFLPHVYRVEYNRMYYVKDHIPVDELSFMMMKGIGKKGNTVKCFLCEVIVDQNSVSEHFISKGHKDKLLASYVMNVVEGMEFLRMIRPNLYHCGICNMALPYWECVWRHVISLPHTFNKNQKVLHCGEARQLRDRFGHRNRNENLTIQLKRLGLY